MRSSSSQAGCECREIAQLTRSLTHAHAHAHKHSRTDTHCDFCRDGPWPLRQHPCKHMHPTCVLHAHVASSRRLLQLLLHLSLLKAHLNTLHLTRRSIRR